MPAKKGNSHGRQFSSTCQPKNRKNSTSRISELIKAFQMDDESRSISKHEAYRLMTHLLSCSITELQTISRHPEIPASILIFIKGIFVDLNLGRTVVVEKLWDRLWGKSIISMEINGAKGNPMIPDKPMSRLAYKELLIRLQSGKL